MKNFEAPRISFREIRKRAEAVRAGIKHKSIPLNIADALEFDFEFEIRPANNLRDKANTYALLYNNAKVILIDKEYFMDERQQYNVHFSLAHELGHYHLHKEFYSFSKIEDWIKFQEDTSSYDYRWFESQANEFAGRLLVPVEMLKTALDKKVRPHLNKYARNDIESDLVIEAAAGIIYNDFGVSSDVIAMRIDHEKVW